MPKGAFITTVMCDKIIFIQNMKEFSNNQPIEELKTNAYKKVSECTHTTPDLKIQFDQK